MGYDKIEGYPLSFLLILPCGGRYNRRHQLFQILLFSDGFSFPHNHNI
jgi:hypothetical protein